MKRFRFTLLAVCLLLLWLGGTDIALFLRNRTPADVPLQRIEAEGAPREWLRISDGCLDLERAISTSGSIELQALLVPLTVSPETKQYTVLVETREPRLLQLFADYHFTPDTPYEQEQFLAEHREEFHPCREVTGMLPTPLVASGNRDKLMTLLKQADLEPPEDALFLSEGKVPSSWRGFFFAGIGLLGLIRLLTSWRKGKPEPAGESDLTIPPQE